MTSLPVRVFVVCCALALLACPANAELVLHYDFSEREGDVLHDKSGKGHDGTITGAKWVTTDKDAALDFDGVNDFVECGNPPGLRISGALTLAVWVRVIPSPDDPCRYIMSKFGWSIYLDEKARSHMETRSAAGDKWVDIGANESIEAGRWNLIVAVHDPSVRQMRMYVNGQPAGQRSRDDESIGRVGEMAFYIGKFAPWPPELNGLVADVKVYNHAVTAEEIAALYRRRPDDALVVKQYRFTASPRYYYREKKMGAAIALFARSPALGAQKFVAHTTLQSEDGTAIEQAQRPLDQDLRAYLEFAMPAKPGSYKLIAAVHVDDEIVAETSLPMEVKPFREDDLTWKGSEAGITRSVPPPWTPLEVARHEESVIVNLSGRRYEFKPDSLVSAILVGQHNLLAAPVQLKSDGRLLSQPRLTVTETSADRVRLSHQTQGDHPAVIHTTIDYDGMIWFDWRITRPPNPLKSLTLEVPLDAKVARLLWPGRRRPRPPVVRRKRRRLASETARPRHRDRP